MDEYSTIERWQEIGETGITHDQGSLYGRFHHLKDKRQKGNAIVW